MGPKHKSNGVQKKFSFPGIPMTLDGSEAVARVESQIAQGGFTHPIIPSDKMWKSFVFNSHIAGNEIFIQETTSSAHAASACEGFTLSGGRAVCFTSGNELVSMKERMFSIVGKRLPVIIHVGTRALTSHSSTQFAAHDDVMAISDTGWGMLFAKNVQEAADFTLIARRAAEESYTPFLIIQDGFLTTHSEENISLPEKELINMFIGDSNQMLVNLFNPKSPIMTGVYQNSDSFMKGRIAQRDYYEKVPLILKSTMDEYYKLTGRRYEFIEKYLMDDAEYVIIGLGNGIEEAKRFCDKLKNEKGIKAGILSIASYRPFPAEELINVLADKRAITVIERADNPLDFCNPLTKDIKCAFADAMMERQITGFPEIYSCTYGLGAGNLTGKEVDAILNNMITGGKRNYSIGVEHSHSIDSDENNPDSNDVYQLDLTEKENG